MKPIAPQKRKYRKQYLKHLSPDQKTAKIDSQIKQVKAADQEIGKGLWKRADELAALKEVYYACYGKLLSGNKLQQLSSIQINPCRLALHAKLSEFYPDHLRKDGVGMRVYEAAYKFNRALKRTKREQFTAAELTNCMEPGRNADATVEYLELMLRKRDGIDVIKERLALRESTVANPHLAVNTTEKWLNLFEQDPSYAIGAAITMLDQENSKVYKINEALNRMGCKWYLTWDDPSYQPDMFEDETN